MLLTRLARAALRPFLQSIGATSVTLHLHVDDADQLIRRAAAAGASVVRNPFGHRWNIGHSIEEVPPEEMQRRYVELLKGKG